MKTNGFTGTHVSGPTVLLGDYETYHYCILIATYGWSRSFVFWCCHRYATVNNKTGDFRNVRHVHSTCSCSLFSPMSNHLHSCYVFHACSIFELAVCCMLGILYVGHLTNGILMLRFLIVAGVNAYMYIVVEWVKLYSKAHNSAGN